VTLASSERVNEDAVGLHPIWRILLSAADGSGSDSKAFRVSTCELSGGPAWRTDLTVTMKAMPPDELILIHADRGLPQALLGLIAHARFRRARSSSLRKLRAELSRSQFEILAEYVIWPSSGNPRVALRAGSFRAFSWVQRSGVLGGGGDRVWARVLARSPISTLLAYLLAPRLALIARSPAGPS
jgi:hypothetical protein